MLLVVEIGNTTTAFALFGNGECHKVFKVPTSSLSAAGAIDSLLEPLLSAYPDIRNAAFCSVVPGLDSIVLEALGRLAGLRAMQVSESLKLPFALHYNAPESFGPDRIALCAYSRSRYPGEAVIALDIGTAITFDVLGSGGDYLGGLIVPGLDIMAKALHEYTARLPLVLVADPAPVTGFSTEECIRNGIAWSCAAGIEGIVGTIGQKLRRENLQERVRVIATGGNAALLCGMTGLSPDLDELAVLRGTQSLFELNCL
ncbi:MAG: type III pantothenate kinase [Chlorobiaceae bacterium]|nr:type III pantothenate kinase [Chlorobiaceae bacterium]